MSGVDARKHTRFETSASASLMSLQEPHWCGVGTIRNVSFRGVLVVLQNRLDLSVGARLQVRFGTVTTTGEVRHVTECDGQFLVGVCIDAVEVTTTMRTM